MQLNFNPRAPCGARRRAQGIVLRRGQFQSTCPLRGTTNLLHRIYQTGSISIHVPLAGHDRTRCPRQSAEAFQSTCPLRGTTNHI